MITGFFSSKFLNTGISICLANTSNCSIAAGLYTSQATSNGFFELFDFKNFASFTENVVFPDP